MSSFIDRMFGMWKVFMCMRNCDELGFDVGSARCTSDILLSTSCLSLHNLQTWKSQTNRKPSVHIDELECMMMTATLLHKFPDKYGIPNVETRMTTTLEEIMTIHQQSVKQIFGIVRRQKAFMQIAKEKCFRPAHKNFRFCDIECWFSGHFVFIRMYP